MAGRAVAPIEDFKDGNCHNQVSLLKENSKGKDLAAISQAKKQLVISLHGKKGVRKISGVLSLNSAMKELLSAENRYTCLIGP